MPPLATHQLDQGAIQLLAAWITSELTNRQSFAQWQVAWFGSTNAPNAAPGADPDIDGANNYYEFLTGSSPLVSNTAWGENILISGTNVNVNFLRLANRGFFVETATNLEDWTTWDVAGNHIWFSASNFGDTISEPMRND